MLDNQGTRKAVSGIVDPIARGLLRIGIKPNHVTVGCALAVTVIVSTTWSNGLFGLGLFLMIPFGAGDLLDGTMARMSGTTSVLGGFLDSVFDRITDAAMVGALLWWAIAHNQPAWVVASGIVGLATSEIIPYVRAKAESLNLECKVGIMERGERGILIVLAVLAASLGYESCIAYALGILAVLNSVTVLQRIAVVVKAFR